MRALRNIAPAPVVLHQHGRLCTACFTNSGNIPSLQRFPCIFSSLCTSPRPKPQINISKHVSCLHPDSPLFPSPRFSLYLPSLLCLNDAAHPPISTHPHPQHHLSHMQPIPCSPLILLSPPPQPQPACLPSCLLAKMCDIFPYLKFCCSTALFNPITSAVCFMD